MHLSRKFIFVFLVAASEWAYVSDKNYNITGVGKLFKALDNIRMECFKLIHSSSGNGKTYFESEPYLAIKSSNI